MVKPEILAPAGGRPQLEAAVWAGADAVYFGLQDGLNARIRADSFHRDTLPDTMAYLHEHGVRGYLTLNTLVFDTELGAAETLVRQAAVAGVDALIVQDLGLLQLARRIAPSLPVHGSTQMSITDAAGVRFARRLGVSRVVLGRELAIADIAAIASEVETDLEVFVHGALCVSYSGQCFSSEAWGGRSANRGQCAQACRLPYGLMVDGELKEQGDYRYLLSPQDLMAIELMPRLIRAGIRSLKIEGRLKGPEYVLSTVSAYRQALDKIWLDLKPGEQTDLTLRLSTKQRRQLAQVFSRGQDIGADGLTPGFLAGPRHQELVIGRNPRHRGVLLGIVKKLTQRGVRLDLVGPIKRGDGVVFDRGRPEDREFGGKVHQVIDANGRLMTVEIDDGDVELRFGPDMPLQRLNVGDRIWRTRDSATDRGTHLDPRLMARPVQVDVTIEGAAGQPLKLTLLDRDGNRVVRESTANLQAADARPIDENSLRKAIGTLGDTPFNIGRFTLSPDLLAGPQGLFLPVGAIKALRRDAVTALLAKRRRHDRDHGMSSQTLQTATVDMSLPSAVLPQTSLLCRSLEQVEAALQIPAVGEIIVDFLEVHGLKDAVAAVRAHGRRLVLATPRIFKPSEHRLWLYYCRQRPDALLIRSTGVLQQLNELRNDGRKLDDGKTPIPPLHGDFSLNAANATTARLLLDQGLDRLTLTHDLNARQMSELSLLLPNEYRERIEVIAHQHLPIFHTEYCVFARFLSAGNSYRDCGRPCESHQLHLRDPAGGDHLVLADIGCRNTVFNASAQSAAEVIDTLLTAAIGHYRIELVDEPAAQVAAIVEGYHALLSGNQSAASLLRQLAVVEDANGSCQGVSVGSLGVRIELPRERMKKPSAR